MAGLAVAAGCLAGTTLEGQRWKKAALGTQVRLARDRLEKLRTLRRVCRHFVLVEIENSEERQCQNDPLEQGIGCAIPLFVLGEPQYGLVAKSCRQRFASEKSAER